jgi:hypothetical protein
MGRRVLFGLMAAMMVVIVAGCGGKKDSAPDAKGSGQAQPKDPAADLAAEMKEKGFKTMLDKNTLQVVAAEGLPKNIECTMGVGSRVNPHFSLWGKDGRVDNAMIDLNAATSVSVVRRGTEGSTYTLELRSFDKDNRMTMLMDFNMDGEWDAKIIAGGTEKAKRFIRLGGEWVDGGRLDAKSEPPTSEREGKTYEFHGTWALSK